MTSPSVPSGKVWLVGAGPGEPDLISCRGRALLESAEVVLYDALSHPELLAYCAGAELVDVGKRYGERSPAQDSISERLVFHARRGKRVVRLKGGDPMMFARGGEEALALLDAGIEFEIVPGITSPVAAAEFAGIPLTHRELSNSVTFITGSDREGVEWSPAAWQKLATATGTICVLMGMRRLDAIAQAIIVGGRSPATPAAVVMWGARPQQRVVVGTLADIAERARDAGLGSPAIVIVGEVVALREQLAWYDTKPLFGLRVLVARDSRQALDTVESLRRRAAVPVVCPAIEIDTAPFADALAARVDELADYDWVVFTSQNGVSAAFAALERRGRDARAFGRARIAVIGPRTAQALERHGLRADLVADEFVAENLAEKLLASHAASPLASHTPQPGSPGRVLLVRAEQAREVLPERLRAAGLEVVVVPAYRTQPVQGEGLARLVRALESETDVVLLSSSSMVDSIVAALGERAAELLGRLRLCCIGPVTAARAREHGLSVALVASTYTIEATLDELERLQRSPEAS
ncbi:MAG TPA: uroporphyrinogen-III C-methyltransferase [Polyangiaceae bacterium]|nr:uroporphyrinogen-III C-methyltransferase [Polyangiaceae bacterium]